MAISKKLFGTMPSGENVYVYTLDNNNGLSAEILSLGGIIKNIYVTDKNGKKTDVVLGRDTLEAYQHNSGCLGAAIGRHANRIAKAAFTLNDKEYHVGANENGNSLHGGIVGFDKKIWDVIEEDGEDVSLVMSITSPDGEEGFPGNLDVTMTYTLTRDNAFSIHYIARSDKDTVVNLTNHSYFNLGGHDSGCVCDHILKINSDFYTPNNSECMPTGEVLSVEGTPFDFREEKRLGDGINADFEQIKMFGGFDHNIAIIGTGMREFAVVRCEETGITMVVKSDKPAMQLYTANELNESTCKNGAVYKSHSGFCIETQYFPNALSHSHYPQPILRKNEEYNFTTEYKFIVE